MLRSSNLDAKRGQTVNRPLGLLRDLGLDRQDVVLYCYGEVVLLHIGRRGLNYHLITGLRHVEQGVRGG